MTPQPYSLLLPFFQRVAAQGVGMFRGWRAWEESTRATITIRPQLAGKLNIHRINFPNAMAGNWIIHDVQINRLSQLPSGGSIPGEAFMGPDANLAFEGPSTSGDIEITLVVEYVGEDPAGMTFVAALMCEQRMPDGKVNRRALPVSSAGVIRPTKHAGNRVTIQIDDRVWFFAEDRAGLRASVRDGTAQWCMLSESSDPDREYLVSCEGGQESWSGPLSNTAVAPLWFDPDLDTPTIGYPEPSKQSQGVLHPIRSTPVSLHALEMPGPVLFGIDERSGKVVFEIGVRDPHANPAFGQVLTVPNSTTDQRAAAMSEAVNRVLRQGLYSRFAHDGYEPTWWKMAELLHRNLLDPTDDLGAIGSAG